MNFVNKMLVLALCFVAFQSANGAWTRQNSGTLAWLHSVYFVNQDKGWIVGSKGAFLSTGDGGLTWRQNRKITEDLIRDVYFSDEQTGWLLCERSVFSSGNLPPSYLLKTFDGGESWETVDFTDSRERIVRIIFAGDGSAFAVGEGGTFLAMKNDQTPWKKIALPVRYLMLGGIFTDKSHGFLVGAGGTILATENGGESWNQAKIAGDPKIRFNSVFFVNRQTGWTAGERGKIYFTNNGGKLWREQVTNVTENLSDIHFINSKEGFAIGDGGVLLSTASSGEVWNIEKSNSQHKLEKLFFVKEKGFAVGFGGTILKYAAGQH